MLTINGDNPNESGNYVCQAKNQHGVDVEKLQVNVIGQLCELQEKYYRKV